MRTTLPRIVCIKCGDELPAELVQWHMDKLGEIPTWQLPKRCPECSRLYRERLHARQSTS